jgi:outer membrane protein assembly factor BamB
MRLIVLTILMFVGAIELQAQDWPKYGFDAASSGVAAGVHLDTAKLGSLTRQQVSLDGTVDSSAVYLRHAAVAGVFHDVVFVTTTYGKTIAIDADHGTVLWEFTPASASRLEGTYRITNATPVIDPDRTYLYAASPDGMVRKLTVAEGRVVWSASVTRLPEREKIASPLGYFQGKIIVATDGYIGDHPPYQGHVVLLDAPTGERLQVWNSLGSTRHELMDPKTYPQSDSGIWGRAGVVVDSDGHLYLSTGNGLWDGKTNWGDAVIELDPEARGILGNYTPVETQQLDDDDQDLGSSSPVLLGAGLIAQGGKDGWIRLLDWTQLKGIQPHKGGEIDRVPTPSGNRLFTAPAVWHSEAQTWLLAADAGGTTAWTVENRRLEPRWHVATGGTSPIVVDGVALVYDPRGVLRIVQAATGQLLTELVCGAGHWNSPIVADGRIILPEGNANSHLTTGILNIWR